MLKKPVKPEEVVVPVASAPEKPKPVGESLFKSKEIKDSKTYVDYISEIDIDSKTPRVRLTKTIVSIGIASRDPETLDRLMDAGMNVARLNFSHGTHAFHAETIELIRAAVEERNRTHGGEYQLGIALDLKGPKIQTGYFEGGETAEVDLKKGATLKFTTDPAMAFKGNAEHIFVDYYGITKDAKIGDKVYLDHGSISLSIIDVGLSFLSCVVENGGILAGQKTFQLSGVTFNLPALTNKDRTDLQFALKYNIDYIFAPFVRYASTVNEMRYLLGEKGKKIWIFSKIENQLGLKNVNEIITASDGIILSRADLMTDIGAWKVTTAQKVVVAKCNALGIPVIVSTQVLESMAKKLMRPRIGETMDVGNAILNGVDGVMLSHETETGNYPVECLRKLVDICLDAEVTLWVHQRYADMVHQTDVYVAGIDVLAMAAVSASITCRAAAIIIITKAGNSPGYVAKYRPRCPIIAVTRYPEVARKLLMLRGVLPVRYRDYPYAEWDKDVDHRAHFGLKQGIEMGFIMVGDHVVIVSGWKKGSLFTNTMRVMYVSSKRALHDKWDV